MMILVVGAVFFRNYSDELFNMVIRERLKTISKGRYDIKYQGISYALNERKLNLSNFTVSPSPGTRPNDSLRTLYEASIPNLEVTFESYLDLYFFRELKLVGIRVEKPVLNINRYPLEGEKTSLSFETGNLYTNIEDYLSVFEIEEFFITHALLDYTQFLPEGTRSYRINDLSFELNDFLLNPESGKDSSRVFYTNNIELNLSNQSLILPDSLHQLSFEQLSASTRDSTVTLKNFSISPLNARVFEDPYAFKTYNYYNISIPEFKMMGIDFSRAYNEDILVVKNILLNDILTRLQSNTGVRGKNRKKVTNTLPDIITYAFNKVLVDTFSLNNGEFNVNRQDRERFQADKLYLQLAGFNVDTSTKVFNEYTDFYSNLKLELRDISYELPDSVHALNIQRLGISTTDTAFYADSIRLVNKLNPGKKPRYRVNDRLFAEKVNINRARLSSFDVAGSRKSREFIMENISFNQPDIQFVRTPLTATAGKEALTADNPKKNSGDFNPYQLINSFADVMSLEKLNISNGNFLLAEGQDSVVYLKSFDAEVKDYLLDSLTLKRKRRFYGGRFFEFYADALNLDFPGFGHELLLNQIRLSNQTRNLMANGLTIQPLGPDVGGNRFTIEADTLMGDDLDMIAILKGDSLVARSIYLQKPRTYLQTISKPDTLKKQRGFLNFNVNALNIEKGSLLWERDSALFLRSDSLLLRAYNLMSPGAPDSIFYDSLKLDTEQLAWRLPDQVHLATVQQLSMNSADSLLVLNELNVVPQFPSPSRTPNRYRINLPAMRIRGVDVTGLQGRAHLIANNLRLEKPEVDLKIFQHTNNKTRNFSLDNLPRVLSPFLDTIRLRSFQTSRGKMSLSLISPSADSLLFSADEVNLNLNNFKLDTLSKLTADNFLFANSYSLGFRNFRHENTQTNKTLQISRVNYISARKRLIAENFTWKNREGHASSQPFDIKLPLVGMNGLEPYELYRNKILDAGLVSLDNPRVVLGVKDKSNRQFSGAMKYPLDTALLKGIDINRFRWKKGDLYVANALDNNPLALKNLTLNLGGLNLSPGTSGDNLLFSNNFSVQIDEQQFMLPDSLHEIRFDNIIFSSEQPNLVVNGFHYNTIPAKYEYGNTLGVQRAWLDIKSRKIEIFHLDYPALIDDRNLKADKLVSSGFQVSGFKDKRVPEDPDFRPPMPSEFIFSLPNQVVVDTIALNKAGINFEILQKGASKPGYITFTDLNAEVYGLTNKNELLQQDPIVNMRAQATVMNEGFLVANFKFNFLEQTHSYNAVMSEMDLQALNPILVPVAFVRIRSGNMNRLQFEAEASHSYSKGEMAFKYDDLKISVINKKKVGEEDPKEVNDAIASFFANTFLVNRKNPRLFSFKKGNIYYERDSTKSIFHYWAQSVITGMISSIGAKSYKRPLKKALKLEEIVVEEADSIRLKNGEPIRR